MGVIAALLRFRRCTGGKIHLLTDFCEADEGDVPDPWYGGRQAFVDAFDLIDRGVDGLLAKLQAASAATSEPARPPRR